jgi:hypothetical protein
MESILTIHPAWQAWTDCGLPLGSGFADPQAELIRLGVEMFPPDHRFDRPGSIMQTRRQER